MYQGRKQAFEVGATAAYSEGKGRRLRFRDGILLRTDAQFYNAIGSALALGSTATGNLTLVTPATVTMILPTDVAEHAPDALKPETDTLWRLGDPPLDSVA